MSSGRRWLQTRPAALGTEWELEDTPTGFTATIALDMDREGFLWAARWAPPSDLSKPWIEPTPAGPLMHEAVRPKKEHGKEYALEDAQEAAEAAVERLVALVTEMRLDEIPRPPKAGKPKKLQKR